ncbi:hypothetical protein TNIN_351191 [Trichonephila inaurata madagascariensis]|uniref:Uncharacterized protein n=1 Tax=Trichonephila inaurata madagascariensis TaxID=2747483 RepID=A0A8X6WRV5_9ARAC|nr:hypothetical protein TNIN_351191 [Trichonephila inaurata madagascariensis]
MPIAHNRNRVNVHPFPLATPNENLTYTSLHDTTPFNSTRERWATQEYRKHRLRWSIFRTRLSGGRGRVGPLQSPPSLYGNGSSLTMADISKAAVTTAIQINIKANRDEYFRDAASGDPGGCL